MADSYTTLNPATVPGGNSMDEESVTGFPSGPGTRQRPRVVIREAHEVTRYDIQEAVSYTGYAPRGTLPSASGWTIKRLTLVAGVPTVLQWTERAAATWDNRASETYS